MSRELLFYEKDEFYDYKEFKNNSGYEISSISDYIKDNSLIDDINEYSQIVDISALSGYFNIQLLSEQTLSLFGEDIILIADKKHEDLFKYELRLVISLFKNVEKVPLKKLEVAKNSFFDNKSKTRKHLKIVDLDDNELDIFLNKFKKNLHGHDKFKDDFEQLIKSFRIFNKIGEHKILSLFLMGESGVGKTEVANTMFKCLNGNKPIAKINFGNYGSELSLSSLIGSARGYVGSDDGEIFMKVRDTDVGIILIDEFEKSNDTLFNYFLDVLESGRITSSMAEEINLEGFIIIFTSNISKENFPKMISPELRSRFNYKGLFTLLSEEDKLKYAEFRIKNIVKKLRLDYDYNFPENLSSIILDLVNVSKFKNMRDINKKIKSVLVKYLLQLNLS